MWIKKLQSILEKIFDGPVGALVLAAFLIAFFLLMIVQPQISIPFVYNQF